MTYSQKVRKSDSWGRTNQANKQWMDYEWSKQTINGLWMKSTDNEWTMNEANIQWIDYEWGQQTMNGLWILLGQETIMGLQVRPMDNGGLQMRPTDNGGTTNEGERNEGERQ
jgi:hypothetical protein